MKINLQVKTDYYIKQLGKKGVQLQQTAADTVNKSAEDMRKEYNLLLNRKSTVRTKFTTNATKVFKSRPISSTGKPRPLNNINAKVVVRNMKGGKEHYLSKLETGDTKRGNPLTMGKVPVPLNTARTSKKYDRAIAGQNRLLKGKTQTLKTGGRRIGVRGDRYNKTGKRWAVLYNSIRTGHITGDPKKPFYMIDNSNNLGIFKMFGKKIRKIRKLEQNTTKTKGKHYFNTSFKQQSPRRLQKIFVKKAKKIK